MSIGEERIPGYIFNFVVNELKYYPANCKLIDGWEEERQEIYNAGGHGVDLAGDRRPTNKTSDPVSAKAMTLIMMADKVSRATHYCTCIEDILSILPEDDKRLVELKYFQPYYTNEGVCRELCISLSAFYRRRNRIIKQFGRRMGLL